MDRAQLQTALTRDRDKAVAALGDERRWDVADVMAVLDQWGVFDLAEREAQYERLAAVLSDLNRCQHGRHEGDVCSGAAGCNGPSRGNPLLPIANGLSINGVNTPAVAGRQVGFDISGNPIVVPSRARMHEPEAWSSGR